MQKLIRCKERLCTKYQNWLSFQLRGFFLRNWQQHCFTIANGITNVFHSFHFWPLFSLSLRVSSLVCFYFGRQVAVVSCAAHLLLTAAFKLCSALRAWPDWPVLTFCFSPTPMKWFLSLGTFASKIIFKKIRSAICYRKKNRLRFPHKNLSKYYVIWFSQ